MEERKNEYCMKIPRAAAQIIRTIENAGYEAFVVGGCVRDMILQKEPQDWDITTSAKPEVVQALFHRTIATGIKHGTVTVLIDKVGYEVTTYRIDGEYEDGRHPKQVEFTASLVEDLRRRDFTINAMAYSPEKGIIDLFGGQEDLQAGIIRCVGEAKERFTEDALRILRALRFSAQLGFEIEEKTQAAIRALAPNLNKISKERIQVELDKLLCSPHPERMELAYELGVSQVILPEWDRMMETPQNTPYHMGTVGLHTLEVMKATPPEHYLRWAAFLHDVGKPQTRTTDENGRDHFHGHEHVGAKMAENILKGLKFDTNTIRTVSKLVEVHGNKPTLTLAGIRRSMSKIGPELYPYFIKIQEADAAGKSEYGKASSREHLAFLKQAYEEITRAGQCLTLKDLAVNGSDLMAVGIEKGPMLGEYLKKLLDYVVEHPEKNTKEDLLVLV